MAIPDEPLGTRVELQIGTGWENVTGDALTRDPITITRGRRDGNSRCDVSRATASFKNTTGKYSPRNPRGEWFGQFGRNTEMRVSVQGPESYLALTGAVADIASTPDTAALDIVGDIDVRIEATADWWSSTPQVLIGKWGADGQRSWMVRIYQGQLRWIHTPDGTTASQRFANWVLPGLPRRAALRVTVDVDNGAGGWSPSLYWAESLDGPWTLVAALVGAAPTTSIHNSTAPLSIAPEDPTTTPPRVPLRGRVHRAEVRSGIGGTVVANPDFRGKTEGTTSFADGAGRTWTTAGAAEVSDREYRMVGEVPTWEPKWGPSGRDVWTPVEASGIQRRLGQGQKPLASTLRRRVPAGGPLAYWPMEEGRDATQAYSAVPDGTALVLTGFDFEGNDSLGGSAPLPKLRNPASMRGTVPRSSAAGWHAEMVYFLPTMPASQTEILRVDVAGSTMSTAVVYASTAGIRIEARSGGDVLAFFLYTNATAIADFAGVWNRLQLFVSDAGGGQTNVCARWLDTSAGGGHWTAATLITGAQGAAVGVAGTWGAATEGMALGHLAVFDVAGSGLTPGVTIYEGADDGFAGEFALDRLNRLSNEEAAALDLTWVDGDPASPSEAMGPQRPAELLDLLYECAETDGGILYETRDRIGMAYRDRTSLYNQAPALTLDYAAGEIAPPLEPVEDDQDLRNDITRTREGGSSARVVRESGPLSVQPPPAGVGVYDDAQTRSLALDAQVVQIAGWDLHLGTWDEARYRAVTVSLHKHPGLIPAVLGLDIGDKLVIANPPSWLPPGPIELLIQGTSETLGLRTWTITFLCTPAGPWTVGVLEDPVLGRLDTDGAVLGAGVDAAGTALEVHSDTVVGPRWIDSAGYGAMFPFDVKAGGERMTVSAITNRADSFTRTLANSWGTSSSGQAWTEVGGAASDRSVNGSRGVITLTPSVSTLRFQRLVATHVADAEVRVRLSASAVATGASAVPGVLLRYVDTATFYRARVHFGTGGGMFLSVTRDTTQIGSAPAAPYTYTAGQEFEFRVRLAGHTMQLKVWPVGQPEPADWQHTETVVTNPIAAGGIGVTGSAFSGLTNVNLELRYDAFEVVTPQLMTVTRAVNGVAKAHAAGAAVSLHDPMRLAL
ncbi:hypothetical protein HHX38_08345 [Streptomyces sp. PKU-MA01144]|uniref:hypothetical protein n=1 Tax=Streptomyces sp. PKU-MA01144 TaxID=2729138 RepID=UPI00147F865C|nr:hypothetical protein [Streptomyces sp. PKU-MA01144]NNJ04143.1 hypothetical protein [Streptomyces sp. PKU-MA01144]